VPPCAPDRARRALASFAAAAATALTVAACRDVTSLQQTNPDQLGASAIYVPANAALIVNSARGDFECGYNGYIVATGVFMDELATSISWTNLFDLDRRTVTPNEPYGSADCTSQQDPPLYTPLSVARASNDTAVGHLEKWTDAEVPNRTALIGVASAYSGYSLVLLGEGMCSGAINLGPELTDAQLFAEARTRFDTAIAAATRAGDTTTARLALLGRARVELDLGQSGPAAADAAQIPPGFEVDIDHDAVQTRRQNLVYIHTQLGLFSSVDTSIQNLYAATHDPRIAVTPTGQLGSDGHTLVVFPNKDAAPTTPQAVAKYSEAQLIIAENDVNTGDLSGAITIINTLQAANGQPAYSGPSTKAGVMAGIVDQRRREFFLEGHRLGDIRRLSLPLAPTTGAPYVNGGDYASQSCLPLPNVERINNPNIGGGA